MKRILAPLAATGLVLASTAAHAAPAIDRAPAATGESEQLFGGEGYPNGVLMLLLAGAVVLGIYAIVDSGDNDGPFSDPTPAPVSP